MERRTFGATGRDLPVIGQGTWQILTAARRTAVAALQRGIELGMTHIDTAEMYDGAEEIIAEAITGRREAWGVSNFDVPDLEEAVSIAGEGRLTCNQVLYHLHERAIEHAVLPWCEKHGVALVGYSPFGHGSLPRPQSPEGRVLDAIAAAHGATARQVILAFLVRRAPLFAIPKASRPDHATENARAGDLRLTGDEITRIDLAFPLGPRARGLPIL